MTFDPESVRLGKHLGVVHDPRTFPVRALIDTVSLPAVPREHRIGGSLSSVPVFANDARGDCTQASKGHAVVTMERSSGQRDVALTDQDIIDAYARVGGYVPGDPATDNGAYELDSLNDWRTVGIGIEHDGTAHKIAGFAAVTWTDRVEVRQAHYVFNGLKVCAALPLSAADQLRAGQPWDVTEGPRARFGSWGGHSMYSFGWEAEGLLGWSWGMPVLMTWAWIDKYVDEMYAVVSEDAYRKSGRTYQGFDSAALDRMLRTLR
jgi:hypothetical protein